MLRSASKIVGEAAIASGSRLRLKLAAQVFLLAAYVAPSAVFAQPVLEHAVNDERELALIEQVREEQSRNGALSPGLIEPLTALAFLYEEDRSYDLAAATIAQARQVVRAKYGLTSIEEAPLLQLLIQGEEARGNIRAAWDVEQELLLLARRNPDDLRTVPIFRELAEKRWHVLERYRAGEFPPEIELGCYYGSNGDRPRADLPAPPSCSSGARSAVVGALLAEVMRHYADAIEALLRNGLYASEELRELELQAVRTANTIAPRFGGLSCPTTELQELLRMELAGGCLAPVIAANDGRILTNVGGMTSFVRLLIYEIRSEARALDRIDALVQLADWQLLGAYEPQVAGAKQTRQATVRLYRDAFEQLGRNDVDRASIDAMFAPKTPIVLPTFVRNPLASEQGAKSTGYIDVAFDITAQGKAENIEILDTTANATRAARKDLVALIERSVFRPRVKDGRLADISRVVVRYFP